MLLYRIHQIHTMQCFGELACRLAQVENTQAPSRGLRASAWKGGAGLEMIGGPAGGKKVDDGSVTGRVPPSPP